MRIEIPSSTDLVGPVMSFFYTLLKNQEIDETIISNVATALIEAIANAITHGNRGNIQKKVGILAYVNGANLCIEVQDQGNGFDLDTIPDPLAPENLMKPSGRGIFLIRSFMDKVIFDFQGQGTRLIMNKNLAHGNFNKTS